MTNQKKSWLHLASNLIVTTAIVLSLQTFVSKGDTLSTQQLKPTPLDTCILYAEVDSTRFSERFNACAKNQAELSNAINPQSKVMSF